MNSRLLRIRRALAFAGLLLALASPTLAAESNDDRPNQIVELNKKALALYEALDMAGAAALLGQALELCKSAKLEDDPSAARTHIHLGVVYVGGLKNRERGLAEFRKALAIDAKIKIAKSLINPEVQAAFAEAQASVAKPTATTNALPFPTGQEAPTRTSPGADVLYEITHPPVTEAPRDRAIAIKAQVPRGLGAAKVVLAYRAEDEDEFLARDMTPVENAASWFRAVIPVEATHGKQVAYYIEARNADDQDLAHSGTPEDPHHIALTLELPPSEKPAEPAAATAKGGGAGPLGTGLWFVLAVGSGGGYYAGTPEMNPEDASVPPKAIHVSGFGVARLLHVAPEIGYFQSPHLILSAQGRFQFVTGAEDVHLGQKTFEPAKMAFAGFIKATWLLGRTNTRLQPFVSGQAGAGQIRQGSKTPASVNLSGCGNGPTCKDTVLGGLGLAGLGAGFTYKVNETLRGYAALTVLAGVPDFMVEADFNLGLAIIL